MSESVTFTLPDVPSAYVRMADWMAPLGWTVTDVAVPTGRQGQGHGRELMKLALDWADAHDITLCLMIAPTGHLGYDELEAWYRRLGFAYDELNILRRRPHAPRTQRHDPGSEELVAEASA